MCGYISTYIHIHIHIYIYIILCMTIYIYFYIELYKNTHTHTQLAFLHPKLHGLPKFLLCIVQAVAAGPVHFDSRVVGFFV